MAVCKLTKDILKSNVCGYSLKQIVDLYLSNYEDVTKVDLDTDGYTVKTITMAEAAKWYHIEPAKDSASYTDELATGDSGSKYRVHTVNFSVSGDYDAEQAANLDALALGRYIAVAKLSNGKYVMFGRLTPLEATTATLSSAAEATGFNGEQFVLTCNTIEPALPMSDDAIAEVVGA